MPAPTTTRNNRRVAQLLFVNQEWAARIREQRTRIFRLLRADLQDEPVLSREQHHRSGDTGGMLVGRKALDSGGLQPRPRQHVLGLVLQKRDGDPGFGHGF